MCERQISFIEEDIEIRIESLKLELDEAFEKLMLNLSQELLIRSEEAKSDDTFKRNPLKVELNNFLSTNKSQIYNIHQVE